MFLFVCLFATGSQYSLGWLQTCCIAKTGLDLLILLPPPKHWDYRMYNNTS